MIQLVYGVLPYLTSVSHHTFPVASLINRQHVMIPRCSNTADPKRPIKLHWKQNNIHAVKVLLKSGMSEYSQTCYKLLTDIQIALKHQSNSLKCPHCVLYKDTVSQSWYDFLSCNMKQVKIELGIYLYMEKINPWIFYFIFYYLSHYIQPVFFQIFTQISCWLWIFSLTKLNKLVSKKFVHCIL